MGLKDDFLEALRSVKRDFFKDYEYTEPSAEGLSSAPPPPVAEEADDLFSAAPSLPADREEEQEPVHTNPVPLLDMEPADPPDIPFPLPDTERDADDSPEFLYSDYLGQSASSEAFSVPGIPSDFSGDEPPVPPADGRIIFDDGFDDSYENDSRTIISKNTVIRGALQTEDAVRMFGQVLGDIDCKSNILVAGKVRGNTSAANAYVIDAQVDGNLLCDDVINVSDDAWILGNIRAQQAEIDGKIKGNLEIRNSISIGTHSSIIGNISTDELEIKRGAFVNGQIMMYSPSRDVIDRFDRFDQ